MYNVRRLNLLLPSFFNIQDDVYKMNVYKMITLDVVRRHEISENKFIRTEKVK